MLNGARPSTGGGACTIVRAAAIEDDGAMGLLWTLIAFVVAIIWILTIVDIVRRHLGAKLTAAWILIVVILPVIGAIVYWAMRKPTAEEIDQAVAADAELRAQAHRRP
jgi:amino acid transporter